MTIKVKRCRLCGEPITAQACGETHAILKFRHLTGKL